MSIQKDVYKTISSGHDLFESPVIIRTWGQPCSSATFFRDIGSPGVPTRGNRLRSSRPPVVPSWLLLVVFLLQKMGALLIQNHNCYYSNMTSQFNVIVCPNWCLFFVIQEEGFYCILFCFICWCAKHYWYWMTYLVHNIHIGWACYICCLRTLFSIEQVLKGFTKNAWFSVLLTLSFISRTIFKTVLIHFHNIAFILFKK